MAHGPFDEYTEVMTSHGVFGVKPGQVLDFDEDGRAVWTDLEDEEPEVLDSDETTADEVSEPGPDPTPPAEDEPDQAEGEDED